MQGDKRIILEKATEQAGPVFCVPFAFYQTWRNRIHAWSSDMRKGGKDIRFNIIRLQEQDDHIIAKVYLAVSSKITEFEL